MTFKIQAGSEQDANLIWTDTTEIHCTYRVHRVWSLTLHVRSTPNSSHSLCGPVEINDIEGQTKRTKEKKVSQCVYRKICHVISDLKLSLQSKSLDEGVSHMVEPLEACSSLVLKTKEHISIRLSIRRGWSHWLWTVLTYPDLPVQDISGDVGSSHGLTAKHKLGFEAGGFQGSAIRFHLLFFSLWPSCKNAEWIKAEQRLVRRQRLYTGIASISALNRKRKKSTLNSGMWFIQRFFVAHLT